MNIRSLFFLSFWMGVGMTFSTCKDTIPEKKKWIIGFSQCTTDDDWRKTMNEEMVREVGFYRNLHPQLIIKNARNSNQKQIQDITDLLSQHIDILIVSPNEAQPLTSIVEKVFQQGIPVIVIDRKINSDQFTAFVGADNFQIGQEAGKTARELLNDKGTILEITGLKGSTPAIERSAGFRQSLGNKIRILESLEGKWLPDTARVKTEKVLQNLKPDLIFAHNDPMAFGAFMAARQAGQKPLIFGIDGLPITNGGVENILKGNLTTTFLYPTGGDKAIQLAVAIRTKQPFQRFNYLNTIKIDLKNARTLLLQDNQIKEQQTKIDKQLVQFGELTYEMERQQLFLLLTIILLILTATVAGLLYYLYWQKVKINKILDTRNTTIVQQNKKITEQRDQLIEMLKINEERTNQAFLFSEKSLEKQNIIEKPILVELPVLPEENLSKNELKRPFFQEKMVLIVEDNPDLRKALTQLLKTHFNVYSADNGKEGLRLSRSVQPDLIISDILMPEMDGLEMCKEIKKHPLTFHIPVILLSALEEHELIIKGLDIGVDAYLIKPIEEDILISQIKSLIHQRENLYNTFGNPLFPLKNIKTSQKEEQEFIEKCVEIIYAYASEEDFNLDSLARHLGFSRSSFSRKIKEITGMKGVDFIKKIKLQYAANLLMNTNATVSEVAWQSGFSDVKYFSKCFSAEFAVLPSKFKESDVINKQRAINNKQ